MWQIHILVNNIRLFFAHAIVSTEDLFVVHFHLIDGTWVCPVCPVYGERAVRPHRLRNIDTMHRPATSTKVHPKDSVRMLKYFEPDFGKFRFS